MPNLLCWFWSSAVLEFWLFYEVKCINFFSSRSFSITFAEETSIHEIFFKSHLYSWKFCLTEVIPNKCFDATELCGKTDADCSPVLFSKQLKGFAMIILLTVSFVTSSKTQQSGRDQCTRLHQVRKWNALHFFRHSVFYIGN